MALEAAGSFGFALAGGYAVQAHGFLDRVSSDIDLFAEASAEPSFAEAVDTELLDLAADHDAGFERPRFAEALAAIDRLPDSLFLPYGMSSQDISALRERMHAWARRIRTAR